MRNFQDLQRALVGFDRFFNLPATTYPPYNVVKKDGAYHLELGVAGFDRDQLQVTLESGELTVMGTRDQEGGQEYLVRTLAGRSFKKVFALEPHHYVDEVTLKNGVLTIVVQEKATTAKALTLEIN